jgi:EAL domain-containing protein (putative c-di-GMP-specific phosphodiesterase class I)
LDAVCIARLTPQEAICEAVAGDGESFGLIRGAGVLRENSLSDRLVSGDLPPFIGDMAVDPGSAAVLAKRQLDLGAFIGIPLVHSDGAIYGTLCGLSHRPDPTLDDRDVRFMSLLADLLVDHLDDRRAADDLRASINTVIADQQLTIAAQPLVQLRDGRCLGVEALSRFRSPFAEPDQTFAAAAGVGLGLELERLAVQRAWELLDYLQPEQFLTINLSPATLNELCRNADSHADLPWNQLVVELTEHSAIDSYSDLRNSLQPFRSAGLRVAVDDAGAGYASLRHVVELRPDFIKIDRELVHGLAEDHARRVAVSAFVLLALDLDATVVAEGLERPPDLIALSDLGVDAAQGYLFGRPSTSRRTLKTWLTTTHPDRTVMV